VTRAKAARPVKVSLSRDARGQFAHKTSTALARVPLRENGASILSAAVTKSTDAAKQQRERFGRGLTLERIEQTLRSAFSGSMRDLTDLNRETISFDPSLGGTLPKRIRPLSRLDWQLTPATGPDVNEAKADFYAEVCRAQLSSVKNFAGFVDNLAWGLWDGRALNELIWAPVTGQSKSGFGQVTMKLAGWLKIHPRRLNVGHMRQLVVSDDTYGHTGNFRPRGLDIRTIPYKFAAFTPSLFGDYVEREGLAIPCLYWSFMKRFSARERMILTEIYGKPWKVIEVSEESGAGEEDLAAAELAADSLGASYTARMPRGTKLVVVRPEAGDGKIHGDTIIDVDNQITKLLLGQVGTTTGAPGGIGSNIGDVMSGEQADLLMADAALLSEAIEDQVIDAIIALNFGPDEVVHAPMFKLIAKRPKDHVHEGLRLKGALDAGLAIKLDEAYDAMGFAMPTDEDSVVRMEQPPTPPGAIAPPSPRAVIIYRDGKGHPPGLVERPPVFAPMIPADDVRDEPIAIAPLEGLLTLEQDFERAAERVRLIGERSERFCCAADHKQPDGPNGNVETLLARGYGEARRAVAAIVKGYQDAVSGKATTIAIVGALYEARNQMDLRPLGRALERRMVQAAALGALDADDEGEGTVSAASADGTPDFSAMPFDSAMRAFQKRKPIPRAQFDRLSGRAKQRAFTVAGVVSEDALLTIQDELAKVIGEGGSLAKFKAVSYTHLTLPTM
jgi:phage gp29-like protein